jgi:hypothetical protein
LRPFRGVEVEANALALRKLGDLPQYNRRDTP